MSPAPMVIKTSPARSSVRSRAWMLGKSWSSQTSQSLSRGPLREFNCRTALARSAAVTSPDSGAGSLARKISATASLSALCKLPASSSSRAAVREA